MNQMWKTTIKISIYGTYEHNEYLYYFGTEEDAIAAAKKYLSTIWGEEDEETIYDETEDAFYDHDWYHCAQSEGTYPYKDVIADTAEGKRRFFVTFEDKGIEIAEKESFTERK